MGVLANVFEAAGLATVGLSLNRGQAETVRAPRMLHCQFPLGRPLGRPNDPSLQHDVLQRAFALLDRDDLPVLADYPEVIVDKTDQPAACPLPPRRDPWVAAPIAEVRALRRAYQATFDANGRTLVGRVGGADDIEDLVGRFLRLADGASLEEVGWGDDTVLAASQDIRAYYEEAGMHLTDTTAARRIESWFYRTTETGALLRRVQVALRDSGADQLTWFLLLPASQSG